jgi:NADH dehydrogenase [ubiquinone] 1 alpha subcomplex assembly factor 1
MAAGGLTVIFDFRDPVAVASWLAIGDRVMGGHSSGRLSFAGSVAAFEGRVSLENGGGFASVRSPPRLHDLGGFSGIALLVRGDGRAYKLNLRIDAGFDGLAYQARFPTSDGKWTSVALAFEAFLPVFRGRRVEAEALDSRRIATFGLLVADRQQGAFRLEVACIAALRGDSCPGALLEA